jgi:malate synthase
MQRTMAPGGRVEEVLTGPALEFVAKLCREFEGRRERLLNERRRFRVALEEGQLPDFPSETSALRARDWQVVAPPPDLEDRTVEITGPTSRKMVVSAMNSGANVYMADFEDAHAPTWAATLDGQANLRDAVFRELEYLTPDGRKFRLVSHPATLMVRPRGWHLVERHLTLDGQPVSASLFDFGLFFFHNARELVRRASGPYFYLPKLEHASEARLWNDVFRSAQKELGIPPGTVRATVLIETLPAAFEMDEILFELREHSAGLNLGRWDYIFSFLKHFRHDRAFVFPDRAQLTMRTPFLDAVSRHLVRTCHLRGAQAIGGMAAQVPSKDDAGATTVALAKVHLDKEREVREGYDGTWVAHPGLVRAAREAFVAGRVDPEARISSARRAPILAKDLLVVPRGSVTMDGVRTNVRVSLRYMEAWLRGVGAVAIDHLMEDAATVEISRTQLWQWVRHAAVLDGGDLVSPALVRELLGEELESVLSESPGNAVRQYAAGRAARLLDRLVTDRDFPEFFPPLAYAELDADPALPLEVARGAAH